MLNRTLATVITHLFYTGLSLELVGTVRITTIILRCCNSFPDATLLLAAVQWKFVSYASPRERTGVTE